MYGWDEYGGYGWMPEDFAAGSTFQVAWAIGRSYVLGGL